MLWWRMTRKRKWSGKKHSDLLIEYETIDLNVRTGIMISFQRVEFADRKSAIRILHEKRATTSLPEKPK